MIQLFLRRFPDSYLYTSSQLNGYGTSVVGLVVAIPRLLGNQDLMMPKMLAALELFNKAHDNIFLAESVSDHPYLHLVLLKQIYLLSLYNAQALLAAQRHGWPDGTFYQSHRHRADSHGPNPLYQTETRK